MRKDGIQWMIMISSFFLFMLLSACSSGDGASTDKKMDNTKPGALVNDAESTPAKGEGIKPSVDKTTELTIYQPWGLTYELFMEQLEGQFLVKKYPKLSFKVLNSKDGSLNELILTNTNIDIIYATEANYFGYQQAAFISDFSDLVKKYDFDVNVLDPGILDYVKTLWSGNMYGMPTAVQTTALYHNRDLFDKFGVDYPNDHMTWDEALEKAKLLTREDGGVRYRGFAARTVGNDFQYNQLSLPLVDPATNKAIFNTDRWKSYIQNFVRFYQVPGYDLTTEVAALPKSVDMFVGDRTLAMLMHTTTDYATFPDDLNWGASALPSFPEQPGVGMQYQTIVWYLSANSPNREAAFIAMMGVVSPETQLEMSKIGSMSTLRDLSIREAFGSALPNMEGRNLVSIIPKQSAKKPLDHKYAANIVPHLITAFDEVRLGQKDINTALRDAEEKTNKWIEERMAAE